MSNPNCKNIILISPSFFGYEIEISNKLKQLGYNVHFIDDRKSNDTFTKSILRLGIFKSFLLKKFKSYFLNELDKSLFNFNVDYVIVISPEGFSREILLEFKLKLPHSKFILYMWDSMLNKKNAVDCLPYYNFKYSFDSNDAHFYNLNFLPLFYIDDYKLEINKCPRYKFCFIGTAHSDRIELVKNIVEKYSDFSFFMYFYLQSRFLYYYFKLSGTNFKNVKSNEINYTSLNKFETIEIINDSEIIIDIHHPNQVGLTMRQIEMIAARKKVITTNPHVSKYDFYNPKNILIIDRDHPIIPNQYVNELYVDLDSSIYDKYSINNWLITMLNQK
jgi:hypothetical protein